MFHRIRYIICSALITISIGQTVIAQDTLTLENCIKLALENNLEATRSNIAVRREGINLRQTRFDLLPSVSAFVGHSYSQGRYIDPATNQFIENRLTSGFQDVSGSLILFDGLASLYKIRQQAFLLRATQMEEQQTKDQLILNVVLAYIQVLTAKDMLEQSENRLEVTEEQVRRNTILHEEGGISPGDYHDIKGEYANDLNAFTDAQATYNEALVALARLLNQPFDANLQLASLDKTPATSLQKEDAQQLYQNAAAYLGTIRAADFRKQQADFGLKVARASFFPTLSLGGGFESRYSDNSSTPFLEQMQNNLGRYASLRLQIPLFNRFTNRSNVARAKLNVLDATYEAETRRNELQQTAQQVLFDLNVARDKYQNLVEQVEHYAESFRVAEVRFNAGDINSFLYLTAKNKMDNANANLVIARYQWHLRQRIVDYYNGGMVPESAN